MANYKLAWLNDQAKHDPAGLIEACEAQYQGQIRAVAEQLAAGQAEPADCAAVRPVVERQNHFGRPPAPRAGGQGDPCGNHLHGRLLSQPW